MLADIRIALRTFLLENSNIAAVVGGERVHPVVLPQDVTDPSIVYNLITEANDHHMQGASGLVTIRMQIDSYAQSHDDAADLALLIKEALDGYSGLMGDVTVQGAFADTARTDYQDEVKLHRVSRDYMIHYNER